MEQSGQPEFVLTATNCELGWVPQLLRISVSMTVKWGQSQDLLLVVVSHGSFHVKPLAQYLTCISTLASLLIFLVYHMHIKKYLLKKKAL